MPHHRHSHTRSWSQSRSSSRSGSRSRSSSASPSRAPRRRQNDNKKNKEKGARSRMHAQAQEDRGRIVLRLLETQDALKLIHWRTESLAVHLATDRVHTQLRDLVDRFVETMQGHFGRAKISGGGGSSTAVDAARKGASGSASDDARELQRLLKEFSLFLRKDLPRLLHGESTDLMNLRDEMLSSAALGLYLASLH